MHSIIEVKSDTSNANSWINRESSKAAWGTNKNFTFCRNLL